MRTMRPAVLLTLCGVLAIGSQVRGDDWKDESGNGRRGGPPPWAGRGDKDQKEFFKKLGEQQREDWKRYEERLREDEKRRREAEREYRKRIEDDGRGSDLRYGYAPTYPYPGGDQSWIGVPGLDAGYDEWRRNAERAYGRGDFYIQGWQQRPYPSVQPDYGYYPPQPSPYGWPR